MISPYSVHAQAPNTPSTFHLMAKLNITNPFNLSGVLSPIPERKNGLSPDEMNICKSQLRIHITPRHPTYHHKVLASYWPSTHGISLHPQPTTRPTPNAPPPMYPAHDRLKIVTRFRSCKWYRINLLELCWWLVGFHCSSLPLLLQLSPPPAWGNVGR